MKDFCFGLVGFCICLSLLTFAQEQLAFGLVFAAMSVGAYVAASLLDEKYCSKSNMGRTGYPLSAGTETSSILGSSNREPTLAIPDIFDENRIRQDLVRVSGAPGIFRKYVERARSRFNKVGERALLEQWIAYFETGRRLIETRTEMERKRSEWLQLANEHERSTKQKEAEVTKLEADSEEQLLRRDQTAYKRKNLEQFIEGGRGNDQTENEQKLNEAHERRQLDARWSLHESLGALHTLVELQHWRRQQRDRVLQDRTLTPDEQGEDLRFIDDLYQQKHAELKADTRIFVEE